MADELQPIPGAERIRAIKDEDGIYKAFDGYPWRRDDVFMSGLYAILGDPNAENPRGSAADMANHARIFYYAQRVGVAIDYARYQDWLARHPEHVPVDVLPEEYRDRPASAEGKSPEVVPKPEPAPARQDKNKDVDDVAAKLQDLTTSTYDDKDAEPSSPAPLSWQKAAPKLELYIDKSKAQQEQDGPGASKSAGNEPDYPIGFAQMLEMIQKGLPIPGIRNIPATVVRDSSIKPFGSKKPPRKPWEKETAPSDGESGAPAAKSAVDIDFPSLEEDSTGA